LIWTEELHTNMNVCFLLKMKDFTN
jgi:hypothetical protein